METLKSVQHFRAFQFELLAQHESNVPTIVIPAGTCGQASGANELIRAATEVLSKRSPSPSGPRLRVTGCHGFCQMEPSVLIVPTRVFYGRVKPTDMARIIEAAANGELVEDLLFKDPETGRPIARQDELPFFRGQLRTILSQSERVEPCRIESYIESGGYSAIARVLERGDSQWVVEEVKRSGLRGRGGAGFPTGLKWEHLAKQKNGSGKFLVCNADEGDPGAYMDRSVLEGNPHSIIEGMLVGAFATGANEGIVYVRAEYPMAIKHLTVALEQAREMGLLGDDILGTGFRFDIGMVRGAGAFVCGEETSLMRSIEGKVAEPRQRPPYPIQRGIEGKPTAINNVETWANIPIVIQLGAEQFARVGTQGNSGTKIFSLVGKIKNTGLVEVPMGITLRQIVDDIGGGPSAKARIKAVQTGGPSGGCIPSHRFDLPVDYDSLAKAGSIMGSGGMIVMDENTCMVDVAKYFMNFLKGESCGKCFTCRKGTQRMYEILDDISKGHATLEDIDLLEELAAVVKDTTLCGLGQTASNPVFSTLRYFRKEYERHVLDKRCDAYVCSDLVGAPCQSACPLGTEPWRYIALLEKGEYEAAYRAIREPNPFPSVCARVCDRKCEQRCRLGTTGGEAIALRALKRFVTDRIDPSVYQPARVRRGDVEPAPVAVVGAGPAGLAAAHELSLRGHEVTVFEAGSEPGGMLTSSIPAYRLPLDVVKKEIASLLDENVTLKCGVALGRELSIDDLFGQGFRAVFLAIGAHKSWRLELAGEDVAGVLPSLEFLKAYNLRGEQLARGRVAVIGGGNAAVDAARVALRQKDVASVCLVYRRTYEDMPAYEEEIEAALEEGVTLQTLVTPVKLRYIEAAVSEGVTLETLVSPIRIHSRAGQLTAIDCVRNRLGEVDSSGRRKPVPIPGTEFTLECDTLIVAIGERPDSDALPSMGLEVDRGGRVVVDPATLSTSREGVFAGGDLVSGPYTVVDAIAAGKKAAAVIERYLDGKALKQPAAPCLPRVFVEPTRAESPEDGTPPARVIPETLPILARAKNFAEVEQTLTVAGAVHEARRCLRCDLAFTRRPEHAAGGLALEEHSK